MTKLCDVCDFQGGSQPPKNEWSLDKRSNYVRMLQIRDFTQSEKTIPEYVKITNSIKECTADDILIARYGASLGKILTGLSGAYNVAIMKAIPDTNVLRKKYLYYFLRSDYFQKFIINVGSRAAQAGFNKEDLSRLNIPCPELKKQDEIVQHLLLIEKIIKARANQLILLDVCVKSRFVEMFGNPIVNNKKWTEMQLTEVCNKILGGGTPPKKNDRYFKGNIPWVTSKDMKSLVITDSQDHITEEAINNSSTKLIPPQSVLMVIRSGILKHTLPVAINDVAVTINQDMKAFIPSKVITAQFLMYYFKTVESDILSGVRAVTADNINFQDFQKRKVIIPPIKLQNEFSFFVQQVDKLKFVYY